MEIGVAMPLNMILKSELKTLTADIREMEYEKSLCEEKIILQEKYITEIKKNKDKIIKEKVELLSGNEEEIFRRQGDMGLLNKENETLIKNISYTIF